MIGSESASHSRGTIMIVPSQNALSPSEILPSRPISCAGDVEQRDRDQAAHAVGDELIPGDTVFRRRRVPLVSSTSRKVLRVSNVRWTRSAQTITPSEADADASLGDDG